MPHKKIIEAADKLLSEVTQPSDLQDDVSSELQNLAFRMKNHLTRPGSDPDAVSGFLEEVNTSIVKYEVEHPKLVQILNNISTLLSSLGI